MGQLKDISDYCMTRDPRKPTPEVAATELCFTKEKLRDEEGEGEGLCVCVCVVSIKVQEGLSLVSM